jgi:hypothetical protein
MEDHHDEQANAGRPDQFWLALEEIAVVVNRIGSKEYLEVPDHVEDDKGRAAQRPRGGTGEFGVDQAATKISHDKSV